MHLLEIQYRCDDAWDREAHYRSLFNRIVRNYTSALAKRATHTPMENHMGSDLPLTKTKEEEK